LSPISEATIVGVPGRGSVSIPSDFVHSDGLVILLHRCDTFAWGSHIIFGSLDFLATGELRLTSSDVPAMASVGGPVQSAARSKAEKRCLKRHATTLKQCINRLVIAIKQKMEEASPSTFVVVIVHQQTSVLDLF
jgi:hypothetical protein